MSADFRNVMRGQFEEGEQRLADDPFAIASGGTIIGRVRRKRTVNNVALSGGTVLAAGALIVAAMQVPFGSLTPAASPSSCVTATPGRDPFPVSTVAPNVTGGDVFDVELPDGAGSMELVSDGTGTLAVVFPDGSTTTVAPDGYHGYFIFAMPNGAPVVATLDYQGDFQVSVGDVGATVAPATSTSAPRVISEMGIPSVECGGRSDAATGSPFQCGFPLTGVVHEDKALEIKDSGYMSIAEATAFSENQKLQVTDPVASAGEPLVPFVTVVSHDGTNSSLDMGTDPDKSRVDKQLGATGVSIVKVLDGRVVAVAATSNDSPTPSPSASTSEEITGAMGFVRDDGLSMLILNESFFAVCPGVMSTAGADLFAVAGSQTWDRQQAGDPAKYVWQKLPDAAD